MNALHRIYELCNVMKLFFSADMTELNCTFRSIAFVYSILYNVIMPCTVVVLDNKMLYQYATDIEWR